MTRRLIALLLCICMIGSMTVYAVDDVTEPTVPESSAPASEPTVPESSAPASEPTVPESSAPASEPTVPESSAPASEPTVPETSAPASEPTVPESSEPVVDPTQPEQADVPAGPAVGDTIYIKSGSLTYKAADENSEKREVVFNYKTKIVSIVTDETGAAAWYEFEPTGLLWLYREYKYVKAENTTTTDPDETEPTEPDGSDTVTTDDGNTVVVEGIPQNAELQIGKADDSAMKAITDYISDQTGNEVAAPLFAYDITIVDENGDEWQPGDKPVTVKLTLPHLKFDADDSIQIMHVSEENKVELVQATILEDGQTVSFEASSFSPYAGFTGTGVLLTGTYFYNMSTATSVNLSTILTAIGHTAHKAKDATKVTPQINGGNTDLITATQNSAKDNWAIARPSALMEADVKLHVVFSDNTSIDITITDQGYKYYLTGTPWDFGDGSETVTITPSGASQALTLKVNKASLRESDMENHKTTYVKPKEGATIPGAYNTIHLLLYVRAGETLKVNTGTYFPYGSWNAADYESGAYHNNNWTWVYTADDGSGNAANYIVTDNVTETVVADIQFRDSALDADKKWIVNAKLIIVPEFENEPTLVRNTLNENDIYDVVKLPITLYNYDGKAFNEYYANKQTYYLGFANYSKGVLAANETSLPWNNATNLPNSGDVSTGIMKKNLENGVPVANSTADTDFFSTKEFAGKDVTENVGFEFIYNKSTGYYTYSSNLNHAQYNESTKTIELYNETLSPAFDVNICNATYSNLQNARAGFYPFGNIQDAFMNAKDPTDGVNYVNWRDAVDQPYFQQNSLYAQDPVRTGSVEPMSSMDMHFGLQLAADFYMPTGSQVDVNKDGTMEDLIYSFTGDDDLWVYVDGRLALDIGGAHTAISGTINFSQKTVTLGSYAMVTANGNEWTVGETGTNKVWTFEELGLKVAEDAMHTLQIFYLERWSGESNCRMHFNLPLVPNNSVNISKNLKNHDGDEMTITPDTEYTFALYTANNKNDEIDATDFTVLKNAPYTVTGKDAPSGTLYTDATTGEFKLKEGQIASFAGISRFTEVYAIEKPMNDGYVYTGSTVSVNKAAPTAYTPGQKTETKVMLLNQSINFDFVNFMQTQPLTIEKEVVGGADGLLNPDQEFSFDIVFTKDCIPDDALETTGAVTSLAVSDQESANDHIVHLGGTFVLKQGESITFPKVPVNMTFNLSEANPDTVDNSFDAPVFTGTVCTTNATPNAFATPYGWTVNNGGENKVKVTNQQRFNLTITKSGFQDVDHDGVDENAEEKQSAIFEVTGPNGYKAKVVICGNRSVTIKGLPVGQYKVKELTDWSWRYDVKSGTAVERTVDPDEFTEAVAYENTRERIYWLSGDNWIQNLLSKNANS